MTKHLDITMTPDLNPIRRGGGGGVNLSPPSTISPPNFFGGLDWNFLREMWTKFSIDVEKCLKMKN